MIHRRRLGYYCCVPVEGLEVFTLFRESRDTPTRPFAEKRSEPAKPRLLLQRRVVSTLEVLTKHVVFDLLSHRWYDRELYVHEPDHPDLDLDL